MGFEEFEELMTEKWNLYKGDFEESGTKKWAFEVRLEELMAGKGDFEGLRAGKWGLSGGLGTSRSGVLKS